MILQAYLIVDWRIGHVLEDRSYNNVLNEMNINKCKLIII